MVEDDIGLSKDTDMYVCPAGHMVIRKAKQGKMIKATRLLRTILMLRNVRIVL